MTNQNIMKFGSRRSFKMFRQIIMTGIICMGFTVFAEENLPKELKDVPSEKITILEDNDLYALNSPRVEIGKDPDSDGSVKVAVWRPRPDANPSYQINMGIERPEYKGKEDRYVARLSCPAPKDEAYHWFKMNRKEPVRITEKSKIYFLDQWCGISIQKVFRKDGAGKKYDFWVLIRTAGPHFVRNSKNPSAMYVKKAVAVER